MNRLKKSDLNNTIRTQELERGYGELDSQIQTNLNTRSIDQTQLREEAPQWTKADHGLLRQHAWPASKADAVNNWQSVEIKDSGESGFVKSEKAARAMAFGLTQADNQAQQEEFRKSFSLLQKIGDTGTETEAEVAPRP